MPLLTVEGIYEDGQIRLLEAPSDIEAPSRVIVTFLPAADTRGDAVETPEAEEPRAKLLARISARMAKGVDLGGPPYPRREDLYDRLKRFK